MQKKRIRKAAAVLAFRKKFGRQPDSPQQAMEFYKKILGEKNGKVKSV